MPGLRNNFLPVLIKGESGFQAGFFFNVDENDGIIPVITHGNLI